MYILCVWSLWKGEEGVGVLGTGVSGDCEPPDMRAGA